MLQIFRYDTIYDLKDLGIAPGEQAKRHRHLVGKIMNMNLGEQDPMLFMLILCLILFTPDFIDLDEPERAEQTQMVFACLLHK